MANSSFLVANGLKVGTVDVQPSGRIVVDSIEFSDNSVQSTALFDGGAGSTVSIEPLTVKDVSGDYSVIATDINDVLVRVNAVVDTTATVTIPDDATLAVPIGSSLFLSSSGIGPVTIVGSGGAVVNSPLGNTIGRQFGRILIIKTAANNWEIDGQLVNQNQFTVIPYEASWQGSSTTMGLGPAPGSSPVSFTMSINGVSNLSGYVQYSPPLEVSGYNIFNVVGTSYINNTQFGTSIPDGLFFRLVAIGNPLNLSLQSSQDWNEWKVYEAGVSQPYWASEEVPLSSLPAVGTPFVKVRMDIADLPTDSAIIGSVIWTFNTPHTKWVQDGFGLAETVSGPKMTIYPTGPIYADNNYYPSTQVGSLLLTNATGLVPGYLDDEASLDYDICFFRVTAPGGLAGNVTYTGDLTLGEVFPVQTNAWSSNHISFSGPSGSSITVLLELMSTVTGPLTTISSKLFTLTHP